MKIKTMKIPKQFEIKNFKYLLILWIFLIIFDVSFKWYCICTSSWILIQRNNSILLRSLLIAACFLIWFILSEYEIKTDMNYKLINIDKLNSTAMFYRIHDQTLSYNQEIETILGHVNKHFTSNKIISINVSDINVWSSDALRFEFLLFYWQHSDRFQSSYACILESDFIIKTEYFKNQLLTNMVDIAYVQHFWGHSEFEAYNIGVLCASRLAHYSTRLWVRFMYFLYKKRFRRLLILGPLFSLVQNNRYVFNWDRDKGCTDYYPHCNYIHFTRPKIVAIEKALSLIRNSSKI